MTGPDPDLSAHESEAELTARLRELRERRVGADKAGDRLDGVLRGIVLARQKRDGRSSPELLRHREVLERFMADLEDLVIIMVRAQAFAYGSGRGAGDPRIRAVEQAVEQAAGALQAAAEAINAGAAS